MFVAWSMFVLIAFVLLELRRYPTDTKKSGATSVKGIFKRQPEDIHLVERLDNKFLPYEEFL